MLDAMPPEQQARARAAIEEVEEEGLQRLQLMQGLEDLCAVLDQYRIPRCDRAETGAFSCLRRVKHAAAGLITLSGACLAEGAEDFVAKLSSLLYRMLRWARPYKPTCRHLQLPALLSTRRSCQKAKLCTVWCCNSQDA